MGIRHALSRIAEGLRRKALASAILASCLAFALLFWASSLLGWPIREDALLCFGFASIAVCAIYAAIGIVRSRLLYRNLNRLSAIVEDKWPHYMDSFAAATELEALERPLRPIEEALLSEVREKLAKEKDSISSLFPGSGAFSFLWRIALAAIFLQAGLMSPRWARFAQAFKGRVSSGSGIIIHEANPDVPMHGDYTIEATITRGPLEAEILWESASGRWRSPLNSRQSASGGFFFTFYDMTEDLQYRIVTPQLSSGVHSVKVYEPPSFKAIKIRVEAPAYTKTEPVELDSPGKVELLEGGRLFISILPDKAASAKLSLPEDRDVPFLRGKDDWLATETVKPRKGGLCRIVLADSLKHSRELPFELEIVPDMPPEITISKPGPDSFVKPGENLRITANAADDFGLVSLSLEYSVSGGEHKSVELKKQDGQREWDFTTLWNMDELQLKDGDILNCQLLAVDNRQPAPNTTRSELFFVTVRPDKDSIEADSRNNLPQKEANVSDLIAESKRLLRISWDLRLSENDQEKQQLRELLSTLEQETRARKAQLEAMAGGNLGPLGKRFDNAAAAIHSAASLVEKRLLEEAIPYQEKALAELVAIETELLRNSIKSKKASEKNDKNEQGDAEGQQEQQDDGNSSENTHELQAMQEAIEELKRLALRQNDLNAAMAGENTQKLTLPSRERKIMQDTNAVRQKLMPSKSAAQAVDMLNSASGDMAGAEFALKSGKYDNAGHYGARAQKLLVQARQLLEEALKRSAAREMQNLSRQAEELAGRQRAASEKSGSGTEDSRTLRQEQKEIQGNTEQLMQRLKALSRNMQQLSPETGNEINNALGKAASKGLDEAQNRAQKALAYKRMKRAAEEQGTAARILEEMAQDLRKAANSLNGLTEQELRQALRELAELASETSRAEADSDRGRGRQRLQQIRRQAAEITGKAGAMSNSEELQRTAAELSRPLEENADGGGQLTRLQIAASGKILMQMLDAIVRQSPQRAGHSYAPPPEKYRKQVEKYYKDISRE